MSITVLATGFATDFFHNDNTDSGEKSKRFTSSSSNNNNNNVGTVSPAKVFDTTHVPSRRTSHASTTAPSSVSKYSPAPEYETDNARFAGAVRYVHGGKAKGKKVSRDTFYRPDEEAEDHYETADSYRDTHSDRDTEDMTENGEDEDTYDEEDDTDLYEEEEDEEEQEGVGRQPVSRKVAYETLTVGSIKRQIADKQERQRQLRRQSSRHLNQKKRNASQHQSNPGGLWGFFQRLFRGNSD